ncbi:hypothetical protein SK128_012562 [Halocaridina rubra]|uniref:Chitin-binding type-2 domain-containing protein n=1 Tax=Halocaridina rubra TaxID=373956 RepID=A0AAN8X9Y2_HALRR
MARFLPGGFRIDSGFSCQGRLYGYYADVVNDCRAYHVCEPIVNENGELIEMAHFTFLCGQNTLFDQEHLACNHRGVAFPCSEAETIYDATNLQLRQEQEAREWEAQIEREQDSPFSL